MSGDGNAADQGPAHRTIEIAVAAAIGMFAVLVVVGALKAGIGWGFEGPKAGFFPFIMGVILIGAAAVNLWNAWHGSKSKIFSEWDQLHQVWSVTWPIARSIFPAATSARICSIACGAARKSSRRCSSVMRFASGCRLSVQSSAESPPPTMRMSLSRNCSILRTA